jgi:hypothetical protein
LNEILDLKREAVSNGEESKGENDILEYVVPDEVEAFHSIVLHLRILHVIFRFERSI